MKPNTTNRYIRNIFYLLIAIMMIGFFCMEIFLPTERESSAELEQLLYKGELFWEKEDGSIEAITAPGDYEVAAGETMVISTVLPSDYNHTSLEIRSSQQDVAIYIDGTLRYQYDTKNTRPFGANSTSRYVFCKTSKEDAGKKVTIELTSYAKKYSGVVNAIYCGEQTEIWQSLTQKYGASLLSALFILFAGAMTVVISIALGRIYHSKINLEFLGWGVVLGALWLTGQIRIRQMLVPNLSALASQCFFVIMLCPVPVLLYVDGVQRGRYQKIFHLLETVAILDTIILCILQFAEILDFLDSLWISIAVVIAAFATIFVTIFLDWRNGKIKDYSLAVVGLLCGMVGGITEIVSAYFLISLSGIFVVIGLILLLAFASMSTLYEMRELENRRAREKNELRRKQAEEMSLQMIYTLSTTIEERDEYAKEHSKRVADYATLLAKELGWNEKEIEQLKYAAILHDIGMICVPDSIISKPTRLSEAEYEVIKRHTNVGGDILKNSTLIDKVEEVARYHHERYDGCGYPCGLKGEEIPLKARIVAIADSYDAMKSNRIYRDALSEEEIRAEFKKNRGTQFDPELVDLFLKLFDEKRMVSVTAMEAETVEADKTLEAERLISSVLNTMQRRNNADNMDYLTGIPMRNTGQKLIAQCMQQHAGCMIFFDTDNLKKVNDIYGHKAGDRVLKLLGNEMKKSSKDAICCRLGGDEFLMFLPDKSKEEIISILDTIFANFKAQRDQDIEIKVSSISAGACMCQKGEKFADCYANADKALYYVKQNGKQQYAFFHQLKEEAGAYKASKKDLEQIAKALSASGNYKGALDLDSREFSKLYEYVSNIGERYKHTCHLVMVTMEASSENMMYIEKMEQALSCMEVAIRNTIRNVDVCTRYSSVQYLIILMQAGEDNIPMVMDRILSQYDKLYGGKEFEFQYEYIPVVEEE